MQIALIFAIAGLVVGNLENLDLISFIGLTITLGLFIMFLCIGITNAWEFINDHYQNWRHRQ